MRVFLWHWPTTIGLLTILQIGCDGATQFSARDDENNKKSSDSSEKDENEDGSGSDEASEPVMVGGAYLACAEISNVSNDGRTEIGCALHDKKTSEKIEMSRYQQEWEIFDGAKPVSVKSVLGSLFDVFHRKFIYFDRSYERHRAVLKVTDSNGRRTRYEKSFSVLDSSLGREKTLTLAGMVWVGKAGPVDTKSLNAVDNEVLDECLADMEKPGCGDVFIQAVQSVHAQQMMFCENGWPSNAIDDSTSLFKDKRELFYPPRPVIFSGFGERCFFNKAGANFITWQGGCVIAPVLEAERKLSFYMYRPFNISKSEALASAAAFVANFKCEY